MASKEIDIWKNFGYVLGTIAIYVVTIAISILYVMAFKEGVYDVNPKNPLCYLPQTITFILCAISGYYEEKHGTSSENIGYFGMLGIANVILVVIFAVGLAVGILRQMFIFLLFDISYGWFSLGLAGFLLSIFIIASIPKVCSFLLKKVSTVKDVAEVCSKIDEKTKEVNHSYISDELRKDFD